MSVSAVSPFQRPGADMDLEPEAEVSEDQAHEILGLIRDKAAAARGVYRRTHAIVQETHKLVEQANTRAREAEARATTSDNARRAAEERASLAEARIQKLTLQLATAERFPIKPSVNDVSRTRQDVRRTRPTLPISTAATAPRGAALRKIWPF